MGSLSGLSNLLKDLLELVEVDGRVVAHHGDSGHLLQGLEVGTLDLLSVVEDIANRLVGGSRDLELLKVSGLVSEGEHLADGHHVGGECAGLVRADDAGAAESLDRREAPHNSVLGSHPESGGVDLHEPEVSGHTVTDGDLNDVSRDDVDGLDLLHAVLVGPDHLAGLGLVLLQSLDSLLSVPLLPDTDNSVGDQDEQDDKGLDEGGDRVVILEEGEDEGDDGGKEQDLDKQVIELFQDQLKDGLSLLHGQLIGAILLLVLLHLAWAQTPLFINTEVLGALLPGLLE